MGISTYTYTRLAFPLPWMSSGALTWFSKFRSLQNLKPKDKILWSLHPPRRPPPSVSTAGGQTNCISRHWDKVWEIHVWFSEHKLGWVWNQIDAKPCLWTNHWHIGAQSTDTHGGCMESSASRKFSKLWDYFQNRKTLIFTSRTMSNMNTVPWELQSWNKLAGKWEVALTITAKCHPAIHIGMHCICFTPLYRK